MTKTDLAKSLDNRTSPRPDLGAPPLARQGIQKPHNDLGKSAVKMPLKKSADGYIVRDGDSTSSIAERLRVSVPALLSANPHKRSISAGTANAAFAELKVGEVLNLPKDLAAAVKSAKSRAATRRMAKASQRVGVGEWDYHGECPECQTVDYTAGDFGYDPDTGEAICTNIPGCTVGGETGGGGDDQSAAQEAAQAYAASMGYTIFTPTCGADQEPEIYENYNVLGYNFTIYTGQCIQSVTAGGADNCDATKPGSVPCYASNYGQWYCIMPCPDGSQADNNCDCRNTGDGSLNCHSQGLAFCTDPDGYEHCMSADCGGHGTRISKDCSCLCNNGYIYNPNSGDCIAFGQADCDATFPGQGLSPCTDKNGDPWCVDKTCGGHGYRNTDCGCVCDAGYTYDPAASSCVPDGTAGTGAPDCEKLHGPGYWAFQDPSDQQWYCMAPCGPNELDNPADGNCYCAPGFARDQSGNCVPVQSGNEKPDCEKLHGPGYWAFFDESEKYWYCMAPCADPNEVPNQKDGNCYCKKGYNRDPDSGKCVAQQSAPPAPSCGSDELYDPSSRKCVKRCREDEVFDPATNSCKKQGEKTDVETGKKKSSSAGVVLGVLALGVFGGMAAYYSSEP